MGTEVRFCDEPVERRLADVAESDFTLDKIWNIYYRVLFIRLGILFKRNLITIFQVNRK